MQSKGAKCKKYARNMITNFFLILSLLFFFSKNYNQKIINGEYFHICQYVKYFVESLRNLNIELRFYVDGPQISKDKFGEWTRRYRTQKNRQIKLIEANHNERFDNISSEDYIRPMCTDIAIIRTLKSLNCEMVYCVGESDSVLAKGVKDESVNVIGIFSRDSDFSIYKDMPYIVRDWFDRNFDLNFETLNLPTEITFGILHSNSLAKNFDVIS